MWVGREREGKSVAVKACCGDVGGRHGCRAGRGKGQRLGLGLKAKTRLPGVVERGPRQ